MLSCPWSLSFSLCVLFLQGVYNPYLGQQYLQLYGVPGTPGAPVYPYGQFGQSGQGGGYTPMQNYSMPSHQILHFGGPGVNAMTSPIPSIQSPYHPGNFLPIKSNYFGSENLYHSSF